jgi:uncharacterized protein (TIRG00374 family)
MKKKAIITILGWVISAALLASLFAHMNFAALRASLESAQWMWLVLAALINLAVMAVKALRWQIIMGPGMSLRASPRNPGIAAAPSGPRNDGYWTILKAAFIGMAGNNVLPARGGDWLRIYLLGKWSGMSKAALASVTGLDKLFDGVAILMLFALFSLHSFGFGRDIPALPNWVEDGAMIVSIVIAASLIICFALLYHYRKTHHKENGGKIRKLIKNLGAGMDMLSKKHLIAWTIIVSLVSTFLQIVTLWTCQQAFGVEFNLWIAAIVFIAINLAIIIPSAPSGVGPFEAAAVLAYTWLHLKTETAFNIALMYHAVQFLPVTIIGFLFYLRNTNSHCERSEAIPCL